MGSDLEQLMAFHWGQQKMSFQAQETINFVVEEKNWELRLDYGWERD
jgi:hypothetical protein